MNAGRLSAIAVWLPVPAAGLLWASSRMTWATVHSADGLTEPRADALIGSLHSAVPAALALVLLASVAALLAVRGWASTVIAVLVGVTGLAAGYPAATALISGIDPQRAADALGLPGRADLDAVDISPAGPIVALLGAALAVVASVIVIVTRRRRRGLSDRFDRRGTRADGGNSERGAGYSRKKNSENPSAVSEADNAASDARDSGGENRSARAESKTVREVAEPSERDLWEALDAGEDPTI
ncbi:Trp biosynthesis-associated membrane protein [Millisia brevis]|uniref:Trp biosynthesis-associated membrane protein n=1 Tax=Millisia brevis TaxID=264148 RepID=UPI0014715F3C|nr:Trp biosynthesis-associated membrane protein [Millisia brevis]